MGLLIYVAILIISLIYCWPVFIILMTILISYSVAAGDYDGNSSPKQKTKKANRNGIITTLNLR